MRQPCVDTGFVPVLLDSLHSGNIDVKMQAGHDGRDLVGANNGITVVLTLLRSLVKNEEPSAGKLRTIACGFLLNLTNTHEVLQEKAISEGVFDILNEYLLLYQNECGLCNMVLLTISSFVENDECREKFCSSPLCSTIVNVLESEAGEVHQETLLDLLINISEWDEVKDALAETSLSNHLIRIIQSNTGKLDDRSQQTIKMASDLLVLLLTGEKSMETLFCKGEGPVFKEMVKWLESDLVQLQLSSALAVGNFARKGNVFIQILCNVYIYIYILRNVVYILKVILTTESVLQIHGLIKHDNMETDITLQHAALSALRNLAIPVANKSVLLQSGVIDTVLCLMSSEVMAVIFKLLGVLRMLVDGQESAAIQLGMNKEFLSRLVEWCDVVEHAGVQGEASRLLAWLVKNGRSAELMRNISRADGIRHLVSMATSEHIVMQNEALVALTLIGATILADAALQLKQADLIDTITTLLQNENTIPEILCNTLVLTKTIIAEGKYHKN
ncbi:hypothetical protein KUTeg_003373 [Tegillarca granosa]|uniref:Rap1 GTPase-GDP dissociation stimulator 1 n=1 Tax=Tegillarca granosa TaxID=220873 RepID=A0ABQ9FQT8_TEGGR|nr:hypothetical protein KUTeg_003373 [Tegillarca granosa]